MKSFEELELPNEGVIWLPVVLKVLGIKRTAFYEGIKKGYFPKPVKLGPRISAWRVEEIRALIA